MRDIIQPLAMAVVTITEDRQAELTQAYDINIAAGRHPYAHVHIASIDDLQWIFEMRMWSGAFFLPDGFNRADLRGADLRGANLGVDAASVRSQKFEHTLVNVRDELYKLMDAYPGAVHIELQALRDGTIDGSQYVSDDRKCGCICGHIELWQNIEELDERNSYGELETYVFGIGRGDTPATNSRSAFLELCLMDYLVTHSDQSLQAFDLTPKDEVTT